jgi:hypothetical protein
MPKKAAASFYLPSIFHLLLLLLVTSRNNPFVIFAFFPLPSLSPIDEGSGRRFIFSSS